MAGDDPEVVADLVDRFLDDAPTRLRRIASAVAAGDGRTAAAAAAELAGVGEVLGAVELAGASRALEAEAVRGDPEAVRAQLPAVETALDGLLVTLADARTQGWPRA